MKKNIFFENLLHGQRWKKYYFILFYHSDTSHLQLLTNSSIIVIEGPGKTGPTKICNAPIWRFHDILYIIILLLFFIWMKSVQWTVRLGQNTGIPKRGSRCVHAPNKGDSVPTKRYFLFSTFMLPPGSFLLNSFANNIKKVFSIVIDMNWVILNHMNFSCPVVTIFTMLNNNFIKFYKIKNFFYFYFFN